MTMTRPVGVCLSVVVGLAALAGPGCGGGDDPHTLKVRVLTYNIGNPDDAEPHYPLRLSYQSYEDYMGAQIRALDPDVVFLQEVLPPHTCAEFDETDPARTCYDAANRPAAVQRILGAEYSVVCDGRLQVECIGVKVAFGTFDGVAAGGFELTGAETPPLPLESCVYAAGECTKDKCDAESTVSAASVATAKGPLRLVHAHPNAPGSTASGGFYMGDACRLLQTKQIFDGLAGFGDVPLISTGPNIIAGDFNMDPVKFSTTAESDYWAQWVGEGKRFTDFGPADEEGTRYGTRFGAMGAAIDHVLAESATGTCTIYGEAELAPMSGTQRLDEGFDFSSLPGGADFPGRLDHFAILCDLEIDLRPFGG
jgi:endonuclease/exonuclease/phosphatase family metal-dependent hydrolase